MIVTALSVGICTADILLLSGLSLNSALFEVFPDYAFSKIAAICLLAFLSPQPAFLHSASHHLNTIYIVICVFTLSH